MRTTLPPDALREIAARASPRTVAAIAASGRQGRDAAANALRAVHAARRASVTWRGAVRRRDGVFRDARVVVAKAVAIARLSMRGVPLERIGTEVVHGGMPATTTGVSWYRYPNGDGVDFFLPAMRYVEQVRVMAEGHEWVVMTKPRGSASPEFFAMRFDGAGRPRSADTWTRPLHADDDAHEVLIRAFAEALRREGFVLGPWYRWHLSQA